MRFNESSCVKCRLQAVFKYASLCNVLTMWAYVVVLSLLFPWLTSIAHSPSLFTFHSFPLSLTHFYYSIFFHSLCFHRSFARELSSSHSIIYYLWLILVFDLRTPTIRTRHKCQPNSKPMPTIQWMRWWSKTIQTDIIPARMIAHRFVLRRMKDKNSGQEKKLRTLTQPHCMADEQDKIHKVFVF